VSFRFSAARPFCGSYHFGGFLLLDMQVLGTYCHSSRKHDESMKRAILVSAAMCALFVQGVHAQGSIGDALAGFIAPKPQGLAPATKPGASPLVARVVRKDGLSIVVVANDKHFSAQANLNQYTEALFAALSPRIPQLKPPAQNGDRGILNQVFFAHAHGARLDCATRILTSIPSGLDLEAVCGSNGRM